MSERHLHVRVLKLANEKNETLFPKTFSNANIIDKIGSNIVEDVEHGSFYSANHFLKNIETYSKKVWAKEVLVLLCVALLEASDDDGELSKEQFYRCVQALEYFEGVEYDDFIEEVVNSVDDATMLLENIDFFEESYHGSIVHRMIKAGLGGYVVMGLSHLEGLDHREIVLDVIKSGQGQYVAKYIFNLERQYHREIAFDLIAAGDGRYVAEYFPNFEGLNHYEIVLEII